MTQQVPVLDLGRFESDRANLVIEAGNAYREFGFCGFSNHGLPSTPHRVVNPPGTKSDQPRYSIPFFLHPNPDFLIETLPGCISAENPDLYPQSISANDFLIERLREIKLM